MPKRPRIEDVFKRLMETNPEGVLMLTNFVGIMSEILPCFQGEDETDSLATTESETESESAASSQEYEVPTKVARS